MEKVFRSVEKLIVYAKENLYLSEKDADYARNGIYRILGIADFEALKGLSVDRNAGKGISSPDELLKELVASCVEAGLIEEYQAEFIADEVMGEIMLKPSEVEKRFYEIFERDGSAAATEWLYDQSVKSDYVKKSKLDKNPRFDAENGLVITINKAKPEFRDPKKAVSGNSVKGGYPKCSICHENEGFAGRNKRTLRTVDVELDGKKWFWQFSPYGYFYQHGIVVNYEHTPMFVEKATFTRLLDFVDTFPHYFIGSNAALERIGGSVLAHDHYQGGGEILPMHKAKAYCVMRSKDYPDAIVEVVDWAGTVVRVVSDNRAAIEEISNKIKEKWVNFTAPELGIIPKDEKGVHNAVSPTVVKTGRGYEMSIILRSNITSDRYPDGIFHAHPEFHIIKKESIGLIEAQGLFILPGRLEKELARLEDAIVNNQPIPDDMTDYSMIFDEIKAIAANDISKENVHEAVKKELASVCSRILDNTAVFKDKKLTVKFMNDLGFTLDK